MTTEDPASGARPRAAAALDAFVRPRFPGSAGWRHTHEAVRRAFTDLGYEERVQEVPVCLVPGTWGLPAAGLALSLANAAAIGAIVTGRYAAALAILGLGLAAVLGIAGGAARATDRWRLRPVTLRNRWYQRPGARPRWLFVAHIDSKSQFVPLLLRASAAGAAIIAWAGLVLRAALGDRVTGDTLALGIIVGIACLSGIALVLSGAGDASPGALDDASGLATILGVAEVETEGDVAFLVTDGEELGLAGSRAAARSLPALEGVINVDGIDDEGDFVILDRYGLPRRYPADSLARAITGGSGVALHRPVPLGLVLDHMSFAKAGVPAVTLMRGTIRSMARVHRPRDDRASLSGRGIDIAVRLLTDALVRLRAQRSAGPPTNATTAPFVGNPRRQG